MVALVGRELYESSKTKKPECPICTSQIVMKSPLRNETEWKNGRCATSQKNFDFVNQLYGYEYFVRLKEGVPCCSLIMQRYEDPFIVWVGCLISKIGYRLIVLVKLIVHSMHCKGAI